MANPISMQWLFLIAIAFPLFLRGGAKSIDDQQEYIVYMGDRPKEDISTSSIHWSMLEALMGSSRASDSLLYSYTKSFNGFVAKMTKAEKEILASMEDVVSVFPNRKLQLHTTRSWDFLGFPQNVPRTTVESDVIVGVLDTGIWPESRSFDASGYGPPPNKWKGTCQSTNNFTCNNKIIGGKYYRINRPFGQRDFASPRDFDGHGSHTASTAAGRIVSQASLYDLGLGTARGGVPSARIAVYKICWSDGCYDADILAAFDDAIADGVDIISLSVGSIFVRNYFEDPIAIGAFHSMKNGILTSNSAGNLGPRSASITNFSPWSLSVAASTIDRKFVTNVQLGNNRIYQGVSVNTFQPNGRMFRLIYGGDIPAVGYNSSESRNCINNSLDKNQASGKIVLCDRLSNAATATNAGANGTIMQDRGYKDYAPSFPISASYLGTQEGGAIYTYLRSTRNPTATIQKSNQITDGAAPYVVSFSSRGPNPITSDILKPDLSAPGVDILAAWSAGTTVTGEAGDNRVVPYNIISGTSMACPHATGIAAYIKSFKPTWSPAAIKSALMTTATPMSAATNTDAEFAYGSGQINPLKATSPGLVYDLGTADYVSFLCGQGYSTAHLQRVTGDRRSSCTSANIASVWDLNYPSFTLSTQSGQVTRVFHRTVTNVGKAVSTYRATITAPPQLNIRLNTTVLSFRSLGEKQSFTVTITARVDQLDIVSGVVIWDDGTHQVRSPIVAHSYT